MANNIVNNEKVDADDVWNTSSTKVLVSGGAGMSGSPSRIYSVTDKNLAWRDGPKMVYPRYCHSMQRLSNGIALVCGGMPNIADHSNHFRNPKCELFLAEQNRFKSLECRLSVPRLKHATALLPNGNVFVMCGGWDDGTVYRSCEIIDPNIGCVFSSRAYHTEKVIAGAACTLDNGSVLFTGGCASVPYEPPECARIVSGARLYDYREDRFRYGKTMIYGRSGHTVTAVENGAIVLGGDFHHSSDNSTTVEQFDSRTGDFVSLGTTDCEEGALSSHFAVLVGGGTSGRRSRVLFGGGLLNKSNNTVRLFDIEDQNVFTVDNSLDNRSYAAAAVI